MKVILTEEVLGLGEPGKIVEVAPGYARNFLVPRKLAVYVNSGNAKELEHNKKRLERKSLRLNAAALGVADRLNGQTLTFDVRTGKDGKLYGSITSADVAEKMKEQFDMVVDRRKITLSDSIRNLGTFEVSVHLMGETKATLNVVVTDSNITVVPTPVAAVVVAEVPEVAVEDAE